MRRRSSSWLVLLLRDLGRNDYLSSYMLEYLAALLVGSRLISQLSCVVDILHEDEYPILFWVWCGLGMAMDLPKTLTSRVIDTALAYSYW